MSNIYLCTDYGNLLSTIDELITKLSTNRNGLIRSTYVKSSDDTYPTFDIDAEGSSSITEQTNGAYKYCVVVIECKRIKNEDILLNLKVKDTAESSFRLLSEDEAKIYVEEYNLNAAEFISKYQNDPLKCTGFTDYISKLSGCYTLIDRISNIYIPNIINAIKGVDTSIEYYQNAKSKLALIFSAADKIKNTIETENYF